jgi:adenylate cyclase
MFELVFLTGARAGQVVPIVKTLLAGRSPDCSLEIPDPNSSRQHSRFVFDGVSVVAMDNGSSNGTWVNDQRLNAPHQLVHGDVVRMGETRIRFQKNKQEASANEGTGTNPSSIFGFKEVEGDISQSILLSVSDMPKKPQSADMLSLRLNAIIKVSKALVNIHKMEEVFEGILETLFEVFPQADRGFLMLGSEIGKLEPKAIRQRGKDEAEALQVSNSICRKALEGRTAIIFDDQKGADFDQGMSIVSLRIRSAMTVPLMVNDAILGLLQIDTPDRARSFTAEDLELAVAVSQQAAIALNNAQLLQKVEKETTTRQNLARFLPGSVVQQALDGTIDLALGGRTCIGTILFSDIVGFTRLSEALHPEVVVRMMNQYFNRMVPCIEQNGGSVDKFMGDAIMAVWGIPFDKGDSAHKAAIAALSMQNGLIGFNSLQVKEGGPSFGMGIGINTGTVVAGNIGTDNRSEYTVLGDAVNVAQRIESNSGRTQVLMSANSWAELKGAGYGIMMPPLKAKNRDEEVPTYSLRGVQDASNEVVLHLCLKSGGHIVWMTRRLADNTFLILHPAEMDITANPLITTVVEWPDVDLGVPTLEAVLPGQAADGTFIRSQVKLADETLAGLISEKSTKTTMTWDLMTRK